jgi:hypothetical protein
MTNIELQAHQKKLQMNLAYIPAQEHNKYIAAYNAAEGTDFPLMNAPTGTPQIQTSPTAGMTPPAQQAPAQQAPVAPSAQAPAMPVSPETIQQAPRPQVNVRGISQPQQAAPLSQSSVTLPPEPVRQPNESPTAFKARKDAYAAEVKTISAKESAAVASAQSVFDIAKDIDGNIKFATGSGLGAKVDDIYSWFGGSTEGAEAIARLNVLGDRILKAVPRFEGPQGVIDVETYKQAAGKLSDPKVPHKQKVAAFQEIIKINKKYAPNLDWDSFGEKKQQQQQQTKKPTVSNW